MKYYITSRKFKHNLDPIFTAGEIATAAVGCNVAIVDEGSGPEDLSNVPKVIYFEPEVLPFARDWATQLDGIVKRFNLQPNQLYFIFGGHELGIDGKIIPCPAGPDRMFLFNYFFHQVVKHNDLSDINFDYTAPKTKMFDCLFGGRKPHRIFIYNRLIESGLLDKSVVNLNEGSLWEKNYCDETHHLHLMQGPGYASGGDLPVYSSPELKDWEVPDVAAFKDSNNNNFYSAEYLPGKNIQVSALVPKAVYNNSYYSIVAETGFEKSLFMSEKIAKPIFAKRVFVLFGSQGLLQHLKDQGFKTFSDVIDESYDLEEDNFVRFSKAWEQCLKLSEMNPTDVYNKLHDVLTHNQQLILDQSKFLVDLKNFIAEVGTR